MEIVFHARLNERLIETVQPLERSSNFLRGSFTSKDKVGTFKAKDFDTNISVIPVESFLLYFFLLMSNKDTKIF